MLYLGTAGYSYPDWVGVLYPEGMKSTDFLSFYATKFNGVEVDFTYYRQPSARTMEGMARKVPKPRPRILLRITASQATWNRAMKRW
jgi:uncharacterized protein YecE (DUF72 family)